MEVDRWHDFWEFGTRWRGSYGYKLDLTTEDATRIQVLFISYLIL
jgi:hypothetical protein